MELALTLAVPIALATFFLFVVHAILRTPSPLWGALKSSLGGVASLILASFVSDFTGVSVPLSLFNIGVSALAGIPGVCMAITLNATA